MKEKNSNSNQHLYLKELKNINKTNDWKNCCIYNLFKNAWIKNKGALIKKDLINQNFL